MDHTSLILLLLLSSINKAKKEAEWRKERGKSGLAWREGLGKPRGESRCLVKNQDLKKILLLLKKNHKFYLKRVKTIKTWARQV